MLCIMRYLLRNFEDTGYLHKNDEQRSALNLTRALTECRKLETPPPHYVPYPYQNNAVFSTDLQHFYIVYIANNFSQDESCA